MDASKLDLTNPRVSEERRADKNYPISWAKMYGKGRVYYSTIGHREESWDRKDVQSYVPGRHQVGAGIGGRGYHAESGEVKFSELTGPARFSWPQAAKISRPRGLRTKHGIDRRTMA